MKRYIAFLVVVLFFSCSVNEKDAAIVNFEKKLGTESIETLNNLVADFETNYLKTYYKNIDIDEAYLLFLKDISKGDSVKPYNYRKIYEMFTKSNLFSDIYLKVDSVWIAKDKNSDRVDDSTEKFNEPEPYPKLIIRFKDDNAFGSGYQYQEQSISAGDISFFEKYSEEEIIQIGYGTRRYDNLGKYAMALYDLQDRGAVFKKYYKARENSGGLDMSLLAGGLLHDNANTSDYFIKRIIVLDVLY